MCVCDDVAMEKRHLICTSHEFADNRCECSIVRRYESIVEGLNDHVTLVMQCRNNKKS